MRQLDLTLFTPFASHEVYLSGQCHEIFLTLDFFIKHLLIVSLDTPRKDFEFFRIFEEFVIDSPVYSLPGGRDSPVYSSVVFIS